MRGGLVWDAPRPTAGWQGLSHVSVALGGGGATLTLHLLQPAGALGIDAVEVLLDGAPLRFSLQPVVASSATLQLNFSTVPGHAAATVRLRHGGALPLHPFFDRRAFRFLVDCEQDDCRGRPEAPPAPGGPGPVLDTLTRDYTGFVRGMLDRLALVSPDLQAPPASLERALLELLAQQADHLSYTQDRVLAEAWVAHATQRWSLQQHGQLLGYTLFEGETPTTTLSFDVGADGTLPAGLVVQRPGGDGEQPVIYTLDADTPVAAAHGRLTLAAWPGAWDAALPAGCDSVLLLGVFPLLQVGDALAFCRGADLHRVTVTALVGGTAPGWVASPGQTAAGAVPVTQITWSPPLPWAVRPWRDGTVLRGNLARASHGAPREAWVGPAGALSPARDRVEMALDPQDCTLSTPPWGGPPQLRALRLPEGPVAWQGGRPLVTVDVGDERWSRVDHLHGSTSADPHYAASADEEGDLWLQFGDGLRGRSVDADGLGRPVVRVCYRIGAPLRGAVAPGALTEVVRPDDAAAAARLDALSPVRAQNLSPGEGARPREDAEAAREAIPAALHLPSRQRAVTLHDYADIARGVPGVAHALARSLGGPFRAVLVLVEPAGGQAWDAALRGAVEAALECTRQAGREVRVDRPVPVPLELTLALCVSPGAAPHAVRAAVEAALRPGTSAHPGLFHPDRLGHGATIELGAVLAAVQDVPGVRSAKALVFRRLGSEGGVALRVRVGDAEVPRLDGDPSHPEHGRLRVLITGMDLDEDALDPAGRPLYTVESP